MTAERDAQVRQFCDRLTTAPVQTPEQRKNRDELLAQIAHEEAGIAEDNRIRKEYARLRKEEDAASFATAEHRRQVLHDQKDFETTVASLEERYGSPLKYSALSPADRATYDAAFARYKKSWDIYAADQAAQKARTENAAKLVEQWRLQKIAFPELYKGSSIAVPCVPCMADAIVKFEKTLVNPILWIKIIDGRGHVEGNAEAPSKGKGKAVQIVNAPSIPEVLAVFGSGDALQPRTTDRLGRKIKLRVKFRYARQETFKWAAIPDGKITYTDTEKGRHGKYLNKKDYLKVAPFVGTTDANGVAEFDYEIGPASTAKWFFRAWDTLGGHDDSATLETWKLIVFGHAKMANIDTKITALGTALATADPGDPVDKLKSYFLPFNVAVRMHSTKTITYVRNVQSNASSTMQNEAVGAFQTELTKFAGCFIVLIEAHGYMTIGSRQISAARASVAAAITLPSPADIYSPNPVTAATLKNGTVSVTVAGSAFTFSEVSDGRALTMTVSQADLDAAWTAAGKVGQFATLEMTYRSAELGAAGFASASYPAFCISRETPYKWRMPPTMVAALIIHELGHQLGLATYTGVPISTTTPNTDATGRATATAMRPSLRKNLLDPNPKIYEARGHQGPHCHHGTALKTKYDGTEAGQDCSMFGQMQRAVTFSGSTANVKATYKFCPKCAKDVIRMDMKLVSMGV